VSPYEESWELSQIEDKLKDEREMAVLLRRWQQMYLSKKLADAGF
jgi:hypothetical protein